MLHLDGIFCSYGPIQALVDVSITVPSGSAVCVLGANGAGKSTVLKSISGLLRPQHGRVYLEDRDITHMSAARRVALGIAHCPEGRRIFGRLTVEENLMLGAHLLSKTKARSAISQACERFPILGRRLRQQAGLMSGGEQQMLAIARALMTQPRLLLLDEPSLGLAPIVIEEVFTALQEIRGQGTTIVLVEQNAAQALTLADYGYILVNGRIEVEGTSSDLRGSDEVRAAYLGG